MKEGFREGFYEEFLKKQGEILHGDDAELDLNDAILNRVEILDTGIKQLEKELVELKSEYDKKFKNLPETDEGWKEFTELQEKMDGKNKAVVSLNEEVDELFAKLPKDDETLDKKIKKLGEELAFRYFSKN